MRILQVNSTDIRGGAARVALSLHQAYRSRGHESRLVVGHKLGSDKHTLPIRQDWAASWWQSPFWQAEDYFARRRFRGARLLRGLLRNAADPGRVADWYHGREDFRYPGTRRLLQIPGTAVDILHLHNLHGHYFDLGQLPNLTKKVPTLLSLHDAWLLSGHCAFSFGCDRWRNGCGHCPDLTIQPAIRQDATEENWQRKKGIYSASSYHVVTPSRWLMDRVIDSPLSSGLKSARVIPHGIDLDIFRPGDKISARQKLGLLENGQIILMVSNGYRDNPWKDFLTARQALEQLAAINKEKAITVLAIGDRLPNEQFDNLEIRFVPHIRDKALLARYYQAADLHLNSSRVEVWGLAISEALACGIPVVAPAVGGIPEQVLSWPEQKDNANGILTQAENPSALANAMDRLLNDRSLCTKLGQNASRRAHSELDFAAQVDKYLSYYREIASSD